MRIACFSCETSYEINPGALGRFGRSVRCARCKAVFFAAAPVKELALTAEPDNGAVAQDGTVDLVPPPDDIDSSAQEEQPTIPADVAVASAATGEPPVQPEMIDYAALAPALVPATEWRTAPEPSPAEAAHEDVEPVAARRAPAPVKRRLRPMRLRLSAPLVILALTAVLVALVAWRTEVVRFAPQTAPLFASVGLPVNLRGLTFEAVKVSGETHEGVPVMVIDGTILNAAKAVVEVPRLRFALHNQAGLEIYAWTALPTRSFLNQGESLPFRTRLASPPADARDLQVRFFNRSDLETGR
jgi:predicted Zn finger-like uncharacterized protein